MENLTFNEMYDAIGSKDSFFEGAFITAVKTTGIFCRPACRAGKPKPENVLFYDTIEEALQNGESITSSAFDSGYDSLSGFNDSFRSIFGSPPGNGEEISVLNIVRFATPLGPMFACAGADGICLLEFTDRRMLETEFKDIRKRLNAVILPGENPHLEHVQKEIKEYFEGNRKMFTVPLHTPGTDFRNDVWKSLLDIPYGKTRSYKEQAIALGNPGAVRAVASATGHNRISIIIPCHRVIGSDGSLTGYGGGLHRKKWLLDFEMAHSKK